MQPRPCQKKSTLQVECFGKLKSIHRSDLADFFHAPNHQQHQPNHWVTPSFFMCSFRCLSTYIPSMLWLHMCDFRIIHPKPEHFCLPFFSGGVVCSRSTPGHVAEPKSPKLNPFIAPKMTKYFFQSSGSGRMLLLQACSAE